MRSILLALFVIGCVFLYIQIETINKSSMATPLTKQTIIHQNKKDVVTNQIAYAPNSYLRAIGTPNGELILWNKDFENNHFKLQEKGSRIVHLTFSEDDNWLLSTDAKDKVQLWNMNSNHLVKIFHHLKRQGYLKHFSEFIEVDTYSESLVFINKDDDYVYYNYETEMLSNKPMIPVASY